MVLLDTRSTNAAEVDTLRLAILAAQTDTRDRVDRAQDSLNKVLAVLDTIRQGEVTVDTMFIPVGGGAVDTVTYGTIVVEGFIHPVPVPVKVAEEIQACRAVAETCEQFGDTVDVLQTELDSLLGRPATDSTPEVIGYVPTVLDSLEAEIATRQRLQEVNADLLDKKTINLGIIDLPVPGLFCGGGGGYRVTGGDGESVPIPGHYDGRENYIPPSVVEVDFPRWNLFVGCIVGWQIL